MDVGYWGADNDYGEMFLNWWLHQVLHPFCGVDLMAQFPEELEGMGRKVIWEMWMQPAMGLRPLPYQAVQGALVVKHLALGDPADIHNIFQWECLALNLPGDADYCPRSP